MRRVSIDTGGTFTDCLVLDENGAIAQFKAAAPRRDPVSGVLACLNKAAAHYNQSFAEFLGQIDLLIHATTLATNALVERRGAKTGMITTKGFRDIVEIRRGYKLSSIYNLFVPPYDPIVPRHRRLGVSERTRYDGSIITPLSVEDLSQAIDEMKGEGVESIAICYLHSYANNENEQRTLEICRGELPGVYLAASNEVLPVWREYERFNTTVISAYVGPLVQKYLTSLEGRLKDAGFQGTMLVLLSSGLVQMVDDCIRKAVQLIGSGPSAAPSSGVWMGTQAGHRNLISVDMGGTSFDVSVIHDGAISTKTTTWVEDELIGGKTIDYYSIGAGGGSIAWVDSLGVLRVGPQSAGSLPGPASYGAGGTEPTVTDADLLLGYVSPDNFLGGEITLDKAAAESAVTRVGKQLGLDAATTAQSIFTIVNATMANCIGEQTTKLGHDVHDFALVVGGGAGPVHGASIAEQMGIDTVLIPCMAGLYSAFGIFNTDLGWDYARSYVVPASGIDFEALNRLYERMEGEAKMACERMHIKWSDVMLSRTADMRYLGQFHEVEVAVPPGVLNENYIKSVVEKFHKRHEELYSFSMLWRGVEFLTFRLRVNARRARFVVPSIGAGSADPSAALKRTRLCIFNGKEIDTQVYDGARLLQGNRVSGPAIVEEKFTTVVVPESFICAVDEFHNYILKKKETGNGRN